MGDADAAMDLAADGGEAQEEDSGVQRLLGQTQELLDSFASDPNDSAQASDALTKAAALFEREELVFRETCSDSFSRDRENFTVWSMLELVVQNESLLSSLFTAIEQRRDAVLQTAAARFLVATAPGRARASGVDHACDGKRCDQCCGS